MHSPFFNINKKRGSLKIGLGVFCVLCALIVIASFSLISINVAHAQTQQNYTLLAPLPNLNSNSSGNSLNLQTSVTFTQYLQYAFNLIIALAAVAAVFMITWGGFTYMTSDVIDTKKWALKSVQNAVWGLLLVLCSWLILRTINPNLVNIPPTFVPQLSLAGCGPNSSASQCASLNNQGSSLFDELQQDATIYQANSTADWQARNAAQAQVTALQNQYNQLQTQADALDPLDPSLPLLQARMSDLQNQIQTQQSQAALMTDKSIFNQSLGVVSQGGLSYLQENPASSLSTIQAALSTVNTMDAKYASSLTPSDKQELDSEYAFTNAELLDAQSYVSVPITDASSIDAAIANIQNTTSAADAKITDATKTKKLDTAAQQEITDLKARQSAIEQGAWNALND